MNHHHTAYQSSYDVVTAGRDVWTVIDMRKRRGEPGRDKFSGSFEAAEYVKVRLDLLAAVR